MHRWTKRVLGRMTRCHGARLTRYHFAPAISKAIERDATCSASIAMQARDSELRHLTPHWPGVKKSIELAAFSPPVPCGTKVSINSPVAPSKRSSRLLPRLST